MENTTLKVYHSEPSEKEITAGLFLLVWTQKTTEKRKVEDADKYRAVMLPKFQQHEELKEVDGVRAVFQTAIYEAMEVAARKLLGNFCKANMKATEVPASVFDLSNILVAMEEQQTSARLSGDTIAAWYDTSETGKKNATRYGDDEKGKEKAAKLRSKYLSLASNNPAISPELAGRMLAYLEDADSKHTMYAAIAKILQKKSQDNLGDDL